MKRAPGLASASRRLRRVGSGSKLVLARRSATSRRLRSAISARTPSAIARLDVGIEKLAGLARGESLTSLLSSFAKARGLSGRLQQGGGVEDHHVLLRLRARAVHERSKAGSVL